MGCDRGAKDPTFVIVRDYFFTRAVIMNKSFARSVSCLRASKGGRWLGLGWLKLIKKAQVSPSSPNIC